MEIEKKYLLDSLPFDMSSYEFLEMSQGYISTAPTIRLRSEKNAGRDRYILAVKGPGDIAREEFELELTQAQFEKLWSKVEGYAVLKTRYLVPIGSLVAEVDVYHGRLDGLLTVEVEFAAVEDATAFTPPDWFGRDVTGDSRYKNSSLSRCEQWCEM